MPIYEFRCNDCSKDSEILVRSSRWKGTRCPHCGSTKLNKKLSVFSSNMASPSAGPGPSCPMNGGGGGCGGCMAGRPHSH